MKQPSNYWQHIDSMPVYAFEDGNMETSFSAAGIAEIMGKTYLFGGRLADIPVTPENRFTFGTPFFYGYNSIEVVPR